jgi:TonB-dependent starch-binding outer membrane protein SusC
MKKNRNYLWEDGFHRSIEKIFTVMKLTFIISLLLITQAFALKSYSQRTLINIKMENVSIKEVLREIEDKSDFYFLYNNDLINVNTTVSIDARNERVQDVLTQLFSNKNISFLIRDRQIVLSPAGSDSGNNTQQKLKTVTGKVVDQSGALLPGASVIVRGTQNGTITDVNGSFTLSNVPIGAILQFSFIGMKPEEVTVTGKNEINVILKEETVGIDEVVAIGYGTAKKRETVGAISKIGGSDITKLPTASISQSLQGMAAGVNVTNSGGGTPGAGNQINIRGLKSISLSSDPLWIVDGVPILTSSDALAVNGVRSASPIAMLNPNDIASIEVLKDAAATAIYGNRASGGVIIVTTKTSKLKETELSVSYDGGISKLPFTQHSVFADNIEYMAIRDEAMKNSGGTEFQPSYLAQQFPNDPGFTREMALSTNTDHLSALSRTAYFHQFGLSANKGFDTGGMLFSLGYRDEQGVLQDNDLKRITARFSTNFRLIDFLELGANTNIMYMESNGVRTGSGKLEGGWDTWFEMAPFYKIYDSSSASGYWYPESGYNAKAYHDPNLIRNNSGEYRTLANIYMKVDLPIKGLTLRGEAGTDVSFTNSSYWRSALLSSTSISEAQEKAVTRAVYTWNGILNYSRTIADAHSVNITAGGEATKNYSYYRSGSGYNMATSYQELINPDKSLSVSTDGHRGNDLSMAGFFFRGNYAYKGKYIFNGSIRYDGHSALSKDNRWAPFAAAGLGWTISEENFMKNIKWLSTLKLRGSYGTTGNTNMTSDMLIMAWSINDARHWGGSTITSSQNWGPSGSSDLKWETTSSYDLGFDFGLFKDRINGSFAVYRQDIDDLIMECQVPPSMGYHNDYNWENVGDLRNKGIEFNISSVNINTKRGFRWTTDFNISTNKNKIKRLNEQEEGKGAVQTVNSITYIRKEGESLNTYYLPKYTHLNTENGLYMEEELDKTRWDNEYVTASTGKEIPMIGTNPGNNRFVQSGKTPQPKWFGGITNNFFYKGFDMVIQFNFAGGNWIIDDKLAEKISIDTSNLGRELIGHYWQKAGDDKRFGRIAQNNRVPFDLDGNASTGGNLMTIDNTSFILERGDFIRLRNLQLGYTLPNNITSKVKINNLRFYVGGSNLLLFTKYTGFDPESMNAVPMPRTINFGLSFKL